ncbi:relaxase/mobilization nuclease domain-containing protein [Pedobacter panaciterrae]|uniref:relaxase/mobilization nuclease domain-containing protein n=1 Tax=Pedobacter panaciterrae TaxID=363849 RepID=UPI002592E28E|nr:relaxase/mobilization nuclease domain-containing protein [uncultured Pedobacter sp.]
MVAIIKTGSSIRRTFYYNENKVTEGVATLIMAGNYPIEIEKLSENQRLNMLLKTAEMNQLVKTNSVHISLNFAPGEQIDTAKMKAIAAEYLDKIGFGDQPYLVYRHEDAGHPHLHIATVKVRLDGTRVETQNIGKDLSEPARIALEKKYNLVKAEDHKQQLFSIKPVDVHKVLYGQTDTRRAIANVLGKVVDGYKYTSLPELNAVLRLYNVEAYRGSEESRVFKNKGLMYRVLDQNGNSVGVPIKASLFHGSPTLQALEKKYLRNDVGRQQYKDRLKNNIDFTLRNADSDLKIFAEKMLGQGIHVIARQGAGGGIYGVTYIDIKTKCVFNGSDLGRNYSAAGIIERLHGDPEMLQRQSRMHTEFPDSANGNQEKINRERASEQLSPERSAGKLMPLLDLVTQYEYAANGLPNVWKKKKRKKGRRL